MSDAAKANVIRADVLLRTLAQRFDTSGSGWLFGHRTIVDAFYAPIATRFRTYDVVVSPITQNWCDLVFADPAFRTWEHEAGLETWTMRETDDV